MYARRLKISCPACGLQQSTQPPAPCLSLSCPHPVLILSSSRPGSSYSLRWPAPSTRRRRCCTNLQPIIAPTSSHGCCSDGAPHGPLPLFCRRKLKVPRPVLRRRRAPPPPTLGPLFAAFSLASLVPLDWLYIPPPRPESCLAATAPPSFTPTCSISPARH